MPVEDRNAYRPITLDAVEKKCLDMCLLQRIQQETEYFLPEWAYVQSEPEKKACPAIDARYARTL